MSEISTWMDEREKKLITDVLHSNTVMLEWGSGGSTLEFSSIVEKYYSIEHNQEWYDKISKELKLYPLNDVEYRFVKQNSERIATEQSSYKQFKDYIDEVDSFNTQFDVVLIDGRARRLCAKKVIPYLKPNAFVFIHDYVLRTPYWVVEDYFELIDSVTDSEQTIAKFKLKNEFSGNAYNLDLGGEKRHYSEYTDEMSRKLKYIR